MGGTAVDATGVMGTDYLADGVPVPAGAVLINGFAHTPAGLRYVCPWPASGLVTYERGIARRHDGAMCIVTAGTVNGYAGPYALTYRGEVIVSTSAAQLVLAALGLRQDGSLCVSEAA